MACRRMLRYSTIVIEPMNFNHYYHIASRYKCKCNNLRARTIRPHQLHPSKPPISCSYNETMLKAISEVGQTTNMVNGGTATDESTNQWMALDQKVNSYPTVRGFTAIGTGGHDFVQAMVDVVESVIQQPIPQGHVKQKLSSRGKYVSVNIGPIEVVSSEQVQAVYNAMRRDDRMKYFL